MTLLVSVFPARAATVSSADIIPPGTPATPGLALRMIEHAQPEITTDVQGWVSWERKRIAHYQSQQSWLDLVERVSRYPAALPLEFVFWGQTQAADAELHLGRGDAVRDRLGRMIWSHAQETPRDLLMIWRRMIIQSYVVDRRPADAMVTLLRYEQDYRDQKIEWKLIKAKVLLLGGQAEEAAKLLAAESAIELRLLCLTAKMRSQAESPDQVMNEVRSLLADASMPLWLRQQFWFLMAEAAMRAVDHEQIILALEAALATAASLPEYASIFPFTVDTLWNAYVTYGKEMGEFALLPASEYDQWMETAQRIAEKRPVVSRAFLAVAASQQLHPSVSKVAHQQLSLVVEGLEGGEHLLSNLYLQSAKFLRVIDIPPSVRYILIRNALASANIDAAARLMGDMQEAPPGVDALEWRIARTRVLIAAGSYELAFSAMRDMVANRKNIDRPRFDMLMEAIFDFRGAGRYGEALKLFESLLDHAGDDVMRRELLFWMADTREAAGKFDDAAALYFASAALDENGDKGAWSQMARTHAADALVSGGLKNDARGVYQALFELATDANSRMILQRKINQIWMVR